METIDTILLTALMTLALFGLFLLIINPDGFMPMNKVYEDSEQSFWQGYNYSQKQLQPEQNILCTKKVVMTEYSVDKTNGGSGLASSTTAKIVEQLPPEGSQGGEGVGDIGVEAKEYTVLIDGINYTIHQFVPDGCFNVSHNSDIYGWHSDIYRRFWSLPFIYD